MPGDAPARAARDGLHAIPAGATLAPATRELLHEAIAHRHGHEAVAFAAQVTRQVAHPLGAAHDDSLSPVERERAVGQRTAAIVRAACEGDAREAAHAATLLAGDAPLLSAFFQNLDMLPTPDAAGDAIAMLVMEAMGRLGGG